MRKYFLFIPVAILAVTALFALCVMLLWNWLLPVLFGLPIITFWQSLGLLLLCKLLFGGFGAHRYARYDRFRHGEHQPDMNEGFDSRTRNSPIRERWKNMSEEERCQFMNRYKRTFSGGLEGTVKQTEDENGNDNDNERQQ